MTATTTTTWEAVIGLEGTDRAFSAFLLQNPTRLVVDIER